MRTACLPTRASAPGWSIKIAAPRPQSSPAPRISTRSARRPGRSGATAGLEIGPISCGLRATMIRFLHFRANAASPGKQRSWNERKSTPCAAEVCRRAAGPSSTSASKQGFYALRLDAKVASCQSDRALDSPARSRFHQAERLASMFIAVRIGRAALLKTKPTGVAFVPDWFAGSVELCRLWIPAGISPPAAKAGIAIRSGYEVRRWRRRWQIEPRTASD